MTERLAALIGEIRGQHKGCVNEKYRRCRANRPCDAIRVVGVLEGALSLLAAIKVDIDSQVAHGPGHPIIGYAYVDEAWSQRIAELSARAEEAMTK